MKTVKKEENYKLWEIGDTFALPIGSEDDRFKDRFFILNKIGDYEISKSKYAPIFRFKITADNNIPSTKEKIDKLEYVKINMVLFENRYRPLRKEDRPKSLVCFPDEWGYLWVYQLQVWIASKKYLPSNLRYLGNYTLEKPKDEFIPLSIYNIQLVRWENLQQLWLIRPYKNYNLKEDSNIFNADYSKMIHDQAAEILAFGDDFLENFKE